MRKNVGRKYSDTVPLKEKTIPGFKATFVSKFEFLFLILIWIQQNSWIRIPNTECGAAFFLCTLDMILAWGKN
jgi:hypothetical protein